MGFPPLLIDDPMPFGKHKGETVEWIIENDPSYIRWAFREVPNFAIEKKAFDRYKKSFREYERRRREARYAALDRDEGYHRDF